MIDVQTLHQIYCLHIMGFIRLLAGSSTVGLSCLWQLEVINVIRVFRGNPRNALQHAIKSLDGDGDCKTSDYIKGAILRLVLVRLLRNNDL